MENRHRRSSILKIRQHTDLLSETIAPSSEPSASTTTVNRRVSFQNVKHVRQYDRDHGKLIEESPLREKITDTMDSDGILTPRGRTDASGIVGDDTINVFGGHGQPQFQKDATLDMSLETVKDENEETMKLFDGLRDRTIYEKVVETTTTRVTKRVAVQNKTIVGEHDMSIDESGVFAVPTLMNSQPKTANQSVLMDLEESQYEKESETMNMFNPPKAPHYIDSNVSMDISGTTQAPGNTANETLALFQSPARKNATIVFDDDEMEVEKTVAPLPNVHASESMDISAVPESNDTLAMFRSPARTKKVFEEEEVEQPDMELTLVKEEAVAREMPMDVDVTMTPQSKTVQANETLNLFKSPARSVVQPIQPIQKVFEEKNETDMEISMAEQEKTSETLQKANDETISLFRSPARSIIQKTLPIREENEDVDMEITQIEEESVKEMRNTIEKTIDEKHEEEGAGEGTFVIQTDDSHVSPHSVHEKTTPKEEMEAGRAMGNSSYMNVSGIQESLQFQHSTSKEPQAEVVSEVAEQTEKIDETLQRSEILSSPQQTMQIGDDAPTLAEMTPIQNEEVMEEIIEEDVEQKTLHIETSDVTVDMEETSRKRLSVSFNRSVANITGINGISRPSSISRRRRSYIRESAVESPRRVALEKSLIHAGSNEFPALGEYRRRKSIQTSQQQLLNSSNLNESMNISGCRDIFALNTSVRSPLAHDVTSSSSSNVPPPSPVFRMPDFDPAVSNVVWLTPEENAEMIPEAESFAHLMSSEQKKVQDGIQKIEDSAISKKLELIRDGQISKLNHDERDVLLAAREEAEIRFLQMRLDFASKHRQNYETEVQDLQSQNSLMAEQLMEVENVNDLKSKVQHLKQLEVLKDIEKIRAEWREEKRKDWERQCAMMKATEQLLLELHNERIAVRQEVEEMKEKLARLEDLEEKRKAETSEVVRKAMAELAKLF